MNVTLSPHHGLPGMAHSSAARAAVENLTRVLSIEWARFGIRLTALAAGPIATETLRTKYPKPVVEGVAGTVPLGRLGTEEEFAWLVAYLASPAGDYFSGTVLTLDGARDNWFGSWPPAGHHRRGREAARRGAAAEAVTEVPELRTERLLMRGWRDEDLDALEPDRGPSRRGEDDRGRAAEDSGRGLAPHGRHGRPLGAEGIRALGARGARQRRGRRPRRAAPPARLARSRGRLDGRARALGKGLRARGGPGRLRVGARGPRRAPHRQPDPPLQRELDPRRREARRDASRAGSPSASVDVLVYGSDLPLVRRRTRVHRRHDDERGRPGRREEAAAAREAAGIGGRKPEYEDEEGDSVDEAERVVIEGGEGARRASRPPRATCARPRPTARTATTPQRTTSATRRAPATPTPSAARPTRSRSPTPSARTALKAPLP